GDEKPIPPVPPAPTPTPTPTPSGSVPKTGVQDNYQSYIIGLCISLLLLVLIFAILVYRVYQEKKTKQINKKP
ncbi:MAG: LPXTG cell wall anchor domain-containing protein, partial [Ruthenibacterium sp.]